MIFPKLSTPSLRKPTHPVLDEALATLTVCLEGDAPGSRHGGTLFPPRSATELIRLLYQGQYDGLSTLDWLRLIDHLVKLRDHNLFNLLLEESQRDDLVCVLMLQQAVLEFDAGMNPALPWERLLEIQPKSPLLRQALYMLQVATGDAHGHRDLLLWSVTTAFRRAHSPLTKRCRREILAGFAEERNPPRRLGWWTQQLDDLSEQERIDVLQRLLANATVVALDGNAPMAVWIATQCRPLIQSLTPQARRVLHGWEGQALYRDFRRLADTMHRSDPRNHEMHRLKSRTLFWSMYQDQVIRRRIVVPRETASSLSKDVLGEGVEVFEVTSKARQRTEVCVFQFATCVVVELFRGEPGETRVFKATPRTLELLEPGSAISLVLVRGIPGGEAMDHVVGWQAQATRTLAKHGLKPDPQVNGIPVWSMHNQASSELPLGPSGLGNPVSGQRARNRANRVREFERMMERMTREEKNRW